MTSIRDIERSYKHVQLHACRIPLLAILLQFLVIYFRTRWASRWQTCTIAHTHTQHPTAAEDQT